MSELLDKIRSRGYWNVVIRPTQFVEKRIPEILDLENILRRSQVHMRGWDYPHIDDEYPPVLGLDHIAQEFEWEQFLEIWKLHQSGQFVHLFALREDWAPPRSGVSVVSSGNATVPAALAPGPKLSVVGTVYELTEIFEFAARLAQSVPGDDPFFVRVRLVGLAEHVLFLDDPMNLLFHREYKTAMNEFPYEVTLGRADLMATAKEQAATAAVELFHRFRWNVSLEMIRGIQEKGVR